MSKTPKNNEWDWLQDRLEHAETPVNPEVWTNVQAGLPAAKVVVSSTLVWISAAIGTLLIAGGIWFYAGKSAPHHESVDMNGPVDSVTSLKADTISASALQLPENPRETALENVASITGHEETLDVPMLIQADIIIDELYEEDTIATIPPLEVRLIPGTTTTEVGELASEEVIEREEEIPSAAFHIKTVEEGGLLYFFMAENSEYASYEWQFSDGAKESGASCLHRFDEEGNFEVTLRIETGENGRRSIATQKLSAFKPVVFEMPNVFTPNGDNKNENFEPVFTTDATAPYALQIMRSNGDLIFQCDPCMNGWNGELRNGDPAEGGTFIYQIQVHSKSGNTIKKSGTIYLSR